MEGFRRPVRMDHKSCFRTKPSEDYQRQTQLSFSLSLSLSLCLSPSVVITAAPLGESGTISFTHLDNINMPIRRNSHHDQQLHKLRGAMIAQHEDHPVTTESCLKSAPPTASESCTSKSPSTSTSFSSCSTASLSVSDSFASSSAVAEAEADADADAETPLSVSFSSFVRAQDATFDLTSEDVREMWYNRFDFSRMKAERGRVVLTELDDLVYDAIDAVLIEQGRQFEDLLEMDEEAIAAVYRQINQPSVDFAVETARKQRDEADRLYAAQDNTQHGSLDDAEEDDEEEDSDDDDDDDDDRSISHPSERPPRRRDNVVLRSVKGGAKKIRHMLRR